ncbi:MAG: hypothetical protein M1825_000598 [Sarcosagium campestre]|nr:MAG: hypothetical protein M1825_000598 [Sarcosagium campestre]
MVIRGPLRLTGPKLRWLVDSRTAWNDAIPLPRSALVRCSSSKSEEDGKSFRGQLYDSTVQRVAREREEQRRYAEARERNSGGGRNTALTTVILATAAISYYLGGLNPEPAPPFSTAPLAATKPPKHKTAPTNLEAAWADFVSIVGSDHVSTQEADLQSHSGSDWSSHTTSPDEKPFLVVSPSTTDEVSQIVKVCHTRRIPITAYSGGTSLEGHFAATRGGICVDFARMDKILELHKEDLDVVVQPALGWESLNEHLEEEGLFFPPDPGPGAMIGGMVGTGCSGTNAYRYGTMKEWVISLTVVLADGTIIKTRQRPRKSSAGYDLTRLFVGSEGTLGLVTEATLKVTVKPPSQTVAVASFPSIRAAAACVTKVVADGVPVAAVEVLDDVQMRCINEAGTTSRRWQEMPTLFFKFAGTPTAVKEQVSLVQKLARAQGSKTFEFARNADEAAELWSARKEALWSVMAKRRDESDHVWTTDVAVPISRLPDIIEETKEDIQRSGLLATIVGHVGDGNFHSILLFNDAERKTAEAVVHRMVKRAIDMEGTVTGEHGVGLVKRDYLNEELGENTVDTMRKIKLALDPLCILNCDKIVRVEKPTASRP